jgi:hypothetical protein
MAKVLVTRARAPETGVSRAATQLFFVVFRIGYEMKHLYSVIGKHILAFLGAFAGGSYGRVWFFQNGAFSEMLVFWLVVTVLIVTASLVVHKKYLSLWQNLTGGSVNSIALGSGLFFGSSLVWVIFRVLS